MTQPMTIDEFRQRSENARKLAARLNESDGGDLSRDSWAVNALANDLEAAVTRLAEYREALEWYADRDNYDEYIPGHDDSEFIVDREVSYGWIPDYGDRARKALEGGSDGE